MIRLHAAYGLKVPAAQEYSSQSYHASAEIEVADTALKEGLEAALSQLWTKLRGAVENQIAEAGKRSAPASNGNGQHNGNGHSAPNGNGVPEPATKKQMSFLLSCARRFKNLSADQARQWLKAEYKLSLDTLSKKEAGQVIDDLQRVSA